MMKALVAALTVFLCGASVSQMTLAKMARGQGCSSSSQELTNLMAIEQHKFLDRFRKATRRRISASQRNNTNMPNPPLMLAHLARSQKSNLGKRSVTHDSDGSGSQQENDWKETVYILGRHVIRGSTQTSSCLTSTGAIASCVEFPLDAETLGAELKNVEQATLWMYYRIPDSVLYQRPSFQSRSLEIHEISRPHIGDIRTEFIATSSTIQSNSEGWIQANVSTIFSSQPSESSLKTKILRIQWHQSAHSAFPPILLDDSSYTPFLEITLRSADRTSNSSETDQFLVNDQRLKRHSIQSCSPHHQNCCLRHFDVKFAEFGWDSWILFPSGYSATYCAGTCNYGSDPSDDLASFIRDHISPSPPCCAPSRRTNPLQIIYAHKSKRAGNVVFRSVVLPNMIVTGCSCR